MLNHFGGNNGIKFFGMDGKNRRGVILHAQIEELEIGIGFAGDLIPPLSYSTPATKRPVWASALHSSPFPQPKSRMLFTLKGPSNSRIFGAMYPQDWGAVSDQPYSLVFML